MKRTNTTVDKECVIVHFTPTKFDRLQMRLEMGTSNFTEASVELFPETTSRFRRQVGEFLIAGFSALAGVAAENWIHKSRMVIQLFSFL